LENDFALLKLDSPVSSSVISPVNVNSRVADQWAWIKTTICDNSDTKPSLCDGTPPDTADKLKRLLEYFNGTIEEELTLGSEGID
jgi:hypothetical protein